MADRTTWRRRLLVAWLVLSAGWVVVLSWYYDLLSCGEVHPGEATSIGWHCDSRLGVEGDYQLVPALIIVAVIVGVPVAVFMIGWAVQVLFRKGEEAP